MYECMMDLAFENANVVGSIYKERAAILQDKYGNKESEYYSPECQIYYDPLYLEEIIAATEQGFQDADFSMLQSGMSGLESQNEGTLLFSCSAIY
jgi:hypothetical protein